MTRRQTSFLMGCCCSVPPPDDNWIGVWEGEGAFLRVRENGKFAYNGDDGACSGYIMSYGEKDRNTKYFRVGGFCGCVSNQEILVQKEPVEESGNWQQQTASKQFVAQTKWRCIVNKHHLVKKQ